MLQSRAHIEAMATQDIAFQVKDQFSICNGHQRELSQRQSFLWITKYIQVPHIPYFGPGSLSSLRSVIPGKVLAIISQIKGSAARKVSDSGI